MKPIKIQMLDTVYKRLVAEAKSDDNYEYLEEEGNPPKPNSLWMLGQNRRTGIIMRALELDSSGGCEFMPAISRSTVTKAYIALAKAHLKPAGYALIVPREQQGSEPFWDGDGVQFLKITNCLLIEFSPDPTGIYVTEGSKVGEENDQPITVRKVKV